MKIDVATVNYILQRGHAHIANIVNSHKIINQKNTYTMDATQLDLNTKLDNANRVHVINKNPNLHNLQVDEHVKNCHLSGAVDSNTISIADVPNAKAGIAHAKSTYPEACALSKKVYDMRKGGTQDKEIERQLHQDLIHSPGMQNKQQLTADGRVIKRPMQVISSFAGMKEGTSQGYAMALMKDLEFKRTGKL